MITTAIIAFREFLEAFLLIGIFVGVDQKLTLGKRKEILFAAFTGIVFSILLPIIVFMMARTVKPFILEKNADVIEGYLLIFSGFFLSYVIVALHKFMRSYRNQTMQTVREKMEQEIFDYTLFFTIVFFISREGFEVALFIATTAVFSVFSSNIAGLLLGFIAASFIGTLTSLTYVKIPIKEIFMYTEYLIIFIGAAMVENGLSILIKLYTKIQLEKIFPLPFQFLPRETTILGHVLKNTLGLQQNMGIIQIILIVTYIMFVTYFSQMKHALFSKF